MHCSPATRVQAQLTSRLYHVLHVGLKDLYQHAEAVKDRRSTPRLDEQIRAESEVLAIADVYEMQCNRFYSTLRHAAPHMFVFVRHPRM